MQIQIFFSMIFMFSGLENTNKIEIYDAAGRQVYEITSKNNTVVVDLKGKNRGIYSYQIINTSTKKAKTGKITLY